MRDEKQTQSKVVVQWSFWANSFGKSVNIFPILDMGVSKNSGTPKSSILLGFSIINHPFWDTTIFGNTHIDDRAFPYQL